MASGLKVTPAQERAFNKFIDEQGAKPFRRQDLATILYPLTKPRLMGNASTLAEHFIQQLRSQNRLSKAGHVHWKLAVVSSRTLKSGREVPELPDLKDIVVRTHCPEKWVSVDLETGDVWEGSPTGWTRARGTVRDEARAILEKKHE